ncbi:MAG: hypothetical protein AAGA97_09450 [Pseudomonadota bacterium]
MKNLWANYSTHVLMIAATIQALWADAEFQALFSEFAPDWVQQWFGLIVLVAFVVAKAIPQGEEIEVEE